MEGELSAETDKSGRGCELSRPQFVFWLASCLLHLNSSQVSLLRKEGARALQRDGGFVV